MQIKEVSSPEQVHYQNDIVLKQIPSSIYDLVYSQCSASIYNCIWKRMRHKIRQEVEDDIRNPLWNQIYHQKNQVDQL
jgi:hypothetical protein